jgi:hypothetical protein
MSPFVQRGSRMSGNQRGERGARGLAVVGPLKLKQICILYIQYIALAETKLNKWEICIPLELYVYKRYQ